MAMTAAAAAESADFGNEKDAHVTSGDNDVPTNDNEVVADTAPLTEDPGNVISPPSQTSPSVGQTLLEQKSVSAEPAAESAGSENVTLPARTSLAEGQTVMAQRMRTVENSQLCQECGKGFSEEKPGYLCMADRDLCNRAYHQDCNETPITADQIETGVFACMFCDDNDTSGAQEKQDDETSVDDDQNDNKSDTDDSSYEEDSTNLQEHEDDNDEVMDEMGSDEISLDESESTYNVSSDEYYDDEGGASMPVNIDVFHKYIERKEDCPINFTVLPLFFGMTEEEENYVPKSLVVNCSQPNTHRVYNMINTLAGNPLKLEDFEEKEQDFKSTRIEMFLYNTASILPAENTPSKV